MLHNMKFSESAQVSSHSNLLCILCLNVPGYVVLIPGPSSLYDSLTAKLGADPLREDATPDALIKACSSSKPIGTVLVDQSVMAGVGNIYRSEILYEAGIHPKQPSNTLTEAEILKLWNVAVKQMQAGFKTGSIWGTKKASFCYGKKTSAAGGKVKHFTMAGRSVYACSKRQRLDAQRPTVRGSKVRRSGTSHLEEMVPAVKAEWTGVKKWKRGIYLIMSTLD